MPPVTTSISVHWARDFMARSQRTQGAPLNILSVGEDYFTGSDICIYTGDQILTDRLVVAINETIMARKAELATKQTDAAAA